MIAHNLIYAVKNELRLSVVGAHTFVNDLGKAWIVANKEPRVNADAMAAYSGTGLKDVDARGN